MISWAGRIYAELGQTRACADNQTPKGREAALEEWAEERQDRVVNYSNSPCLPCKLVHVNRPVLHFRNIFSLT